VCQNTVYHTLTMIDNNDKEVISTAYNLMARIPESEYMDFERDLGNGITLVLEKPQDFPNVEVMIVVKETDLEYDNPDEYTNSLKTHCEDMGELVEELEEITEIEGLDFLCDPYENTDTDYWKGYSPYDH